MLIRGPVAQWIEQLRPKEKVVRSTRSWATIKAQCRFFLIAFRGDKMFMLEYSYGDYF